MTLKSEVAELHYEVAELSSGELRLTFTTGSDTELWPFSLPTNCGPGTAACLAPPQCVRVYEANYNKKAVLSQR